MDPCTCNDSTTKSNILNEYFASDFNVEDTTNTPDMKESPYPSIASIIVTLTGVTNLLQNHNSHKAYGPDQIPIRLLKETSTQIAPVLLLIFKALLQQGKYQKTINMLSYVTPEFKSSERSKPGNYRPVSLACVCCKLLEHIIYSSIMTHLRNQHVLSEAQHTWFSEVLLL